MYLYATSLKTGLTYTIEPTRRGSRKLLASAMTARGKDLDVRIAWRKVPLDIRRSARLTYQ